MSKNNSLADHFYQILWRQSPPKVDAARVKQEFDSLSGLQQHLAITFIRLERMLKHLYNGDLYSAFYCAGALMVSALLEMQDRAIDPAALKKKTDRELPEE